MTKASEIRGGADPLVAAAIIAAVARLEEERDAAAALPPSRPVQGKWVLSGRPKDVTPPSTARPVPAADGWSVVTPAVDLDPPAG